MLRVFFFWLVVIILIQPILSSIDYYLDLHVRAVTAYVAEKAAPEGMVSPQLHQEAVDMLTAVGFKEDDIIINYDNSIHERGESITVSIQVPRDMMFVYRFISNMPTFYYAKSTVMSEWLD